MEGKGLQKIERRVLSDWSLYHYAVSFFVSWTFFILKSILTDMSIATPAFFWFPFAWNTFFHPLTFTVYVSLDLKWVFCRNLIYGSWFCIPSGSLCLLVGALSVQFSRSVVSDFVTLWTAARQASLSITNSQNSPKLICIKSVIQPSHPLPSPSSPAPNPSQHPGLFQWVNSSHEVAKVLEFQPQHQSFQWTPRTDLL